MAVSDSMFLFEFLVEELCSFTDCKRFCIKTQFADVFTVQLRDPNQKERKRSKGKYKIKHEVKLKLSKRSSSSPEPKVETGQTILLASDIESLINNMRQYPMELCLYSYVSPEYKLGSTNIAWNSLYIDYLNKINLKLEPPPMVTSTEYNVFDEYTSRRMARIKLNIKLTHLKDQITTPVRPISEEYKKAFMFIESNADDVNKTKIDTIEESHGDSILEPGTIKTIYNHDYIKKCNRIRYRALNKDKKNAHLVSVEENILKSETDMDIKKPDTEVKVLTEINSTNTVHNSIMSLTRSNTEIDNKKQITVIKSKSYSSFDYKERLEMLNLIFGDPTGPFGNKVYYVGYFTVANDKPKASPTTSNTSKEKHKTSPTTSNTSKESIKNTPGNETPSLKDRYIIKLCDNECREKNAGSGICAESVHSIDLPEEAAHLITVKKCKLIECEHKKFLKPLPPPDDRILIDYKNMNMKCCDVQKIEEVVGGMTAKMKVGEDPCYCACECRFGFFKKTTYCTICGGYEIMGEELTQKDLPFPCPIYHKLVDKNKLKASSVPTSDSKKKIEDVSKAGPRRATGSDKKSVESEKDSKKGKKSILKDDRFKFNYGYQGIPPHIGHSQCAMPCAGTLGQVPKKMGWLWTSENVPGMKFRPNWKPGACNKHVVRLLRIARYPEQEIGKRRKRDSGKKKRPLKRPLLTVQKKEGEYTVTMETMKIFNRTRLPNTYPYEDKPLVTYTIGRTEEENRIRQKKRERAHRRLEREQREFIQSAFRDMCKEICMKTYRQALGLLPDGEDPDCTCYPAEPGPDKTNLEHSCSCSDSLSSFGSDTDDDEWIVEFTPPNALFDPTFKGKKVNLIDTATQYTYLDYRVKLLDRYGNPVPRFFIGTDGKQYCSDLGGFWGPDKKWLEINFDGFIAQDGRWAPNSFFGPNGEQVDTDTGKFQTVNGAWLVIGVDGYIDSHNKWRYYPMRNQAQQAKKQAVKKTVGTGDKKGHHEKEPPKTSEATWSCFGDASPRHLSHMGIVGHGHDRKLLLSTLECLLAQGEDVKIPQQSSVPRSARKKGSKKARTTPSRYDARSQVDKFKCTHPIPSAKGIVAVNERGHKTYFRLTEHKNMRPKERQMRLGEHGISLSSFHVPCLSSFISTEAMKQQQYEHILEHNARYRNTGTG